MTLLPGVVRNQTRWHRRARATTFLGSVLVLGACGGAGSSVPASHSEATSTRTASCVAPYLDNQPPGGRYGTPSPQVRPGASVVIYGHGYTRTCDDVNPGHEAAKPLPPVTLTLSIPGEKTQQLGKFTPHGRDAGFSVRVRIPSAAQSGTATVRDDRSPNPSSYRFTIAD